MWGILIVAAVIMVYSGPKESPASLRLFVSNNGAIQEQEECCTMRHKCQMTLMNALLYKG